MSGPLDGIQVVELANWQAAPAAAACLADMGASVIKVEPPAGDQTRGIVSPVTNYLFGADNRGKRGITANLESPAGSAVVRRLVARADVLLLNLTPSRAERYGLTYA